MPSWDKVVVAYEPVWELELVKMLCNPETRETFVLIFVSFLSDSYFCILIISCQTVVYRSLS